MGLKEDMDSIKGFEDAWNDVDHPVFTNKDSYTWKSNVHKEPKFHYSFTSGDAYFCIPPYP
jgi:sulfide:quinone oxidoreductase